MSSLLEQTQYKIWDEGALVTLQVGNVPITMDYTTALAIARKLALVAKQAKRRSGDTSMDFKAMGILTDAEVEEKIVQGMRDGTARFG